MIIVESFDIKLFAKRLKKLREDKKKEDSKYTQGFVADLIGVARPTYTAYENGTKEPPLENVFRIANLFGVTSDYLLGRSDNPNKTEHDYLEEIIKNDEIFDGVSVERYGKILDLEEWIKFLNNNEITLNGKLLTGEERRRAVEVLKAMFNIRKDT